jgi:ribosome hibernation promoting factor
MQLQVKGRNVEITDSIRAYAERKLGKLERQLGDVRVELELIQERNPSIAAKQVAEAAVFPARGPAIRAKEASADMKASIDKLAEKLLREVKKQRDKQAHRHLRHREPKHVPAPPSGEE